MSIVDSGLMPPHPVRTTIAQRMSACGCHGQKE